MAPRGRSSQTERINVGVLEAALSLKARLRRNPALCGSAGAGASHSLSVGDDVPPRTERGLTGRKTGIREPTARMIMTPFVRRPLLAGLSMTLLICAEASGSTERVSLWNGGVQANFVSAYPAISADGRHMAFQCRASNWHPGASGYLDVLLEFGTSCP